MARPTAARRSVPSRPADAECPAAPATPRNPPRRASSTIATMAPRARSSGTPPGHGGDRAASWTQVPPPTRCADGPRTGPRRERARSALPPHPSDCWHCRSHPRSGPTERSRRPGPRRAPSAFPQSRADIRTESRTRPAPVDRAPAHPRRDRQDGSSPHGGSRNNRPASRRPLPARARSRRAPD